MILESDLFDSLRRWRCGGVRGCGCGWALLSGVVNVFSGVFLLDTSHVPVEYAKSQTAVFGFSFVAIGNGDEKPFVIIGRFN